MGVAPRILENLRPAALLSSWTPPLDHILSQVSPVRVLVTYFSILLFNIILPFTCYVWPPKCSAFMCLLCELVTFDLIIVVFGAQ